MLRLFLAQGRTSKFPDERNSKTRRKEKRGKGPSDDETGEGPGEKDGVREQRKDGGGRVEGRHPLPPPERRPGQQVKPHKVRSNFARGGVHHRKPSGGWVQFLLISIPVPARGA